jgi:hypothetical protein
VESGVDEMTDKLTWEERFEAMQSLGDCSLRMRKPGDWYMNLRGVNIRKDSMLSAVCGDGNDPITAILSTWRALTELKAREYITVDSMGKEFNYRWNGYMWKEMMTR